MDGFGFRLPWVLRATLVEWGALFVTASEVVFRDSNLAGSET